jgi:nitrite reductase/ring-hydroxylating ferredoxin subunit
VVTPSPDGPAATPVTSTDQHSEDLYRAHWQSRQEERLATRRRILRWAIRIGAGAFSLALLLPALAIRSLTREVEEVTAGDLLVYATGERSGLPVDAEALAPGSAVQVFPEGKSDNERTLIELVRIGEDLPAGLVGYSAICTHLGCTVLATLNHDGYIVCPCHASMFDPARDAQVMQGPAARPLPSLPIEIANDGRVVAAGGFAGPVGPA